MISEETRSVAIEDNINQTFSPPFVRPPYSCGMEGVYLTKPNGERAQILNVPLWVAEICRDGDGCHYAVIECLTPSYHHQDVLPVSKACSPHAMKLFLLNRCIVPFNDRRPSEVSDYVLDCVEAWREEGRKPPRIEDIRARLDRSRE